MELISSLLGQVIGVGVIALIIVFQQEVRRFLLVIGNRYLKNTQFSINRLFSLKEEQGSPKEAEEIVRAAESMSSKKIGALIVIGTTQPAGYIHPRVERYLKPDISAELLETIFFKNTPLHDGAVLIQDGIILAARCPFPITDRVYCHIKIRYAAQGCNRHVRTYRCSCGCCFGGIRRDNCC